MCSTIKEIPASKSEDDKKKEHNRSFGEKIVNKVKHSALMDNIRYHYSFFLMTMSHCLLKDASLVELLDNVIEFGETLYCNFHKI